MPAAGSVRWQERFSNLDRACKRLQSACAQSKYTELELAGLVHTFKLAFELAWKTLRDLLVFEGHQVATPREAIRTAFSAGLLEDPDLWLVAMESRRRLSRLYDERISAEAEALIKNSYAPLIAALVERLCRKRDQSG